MRPVRESAREQLRNRPPQTIEARGTEITSVIIDGFVNNAIL
jgi:hypothetical protein